MPNQKNIPISADFNFFINSKGECTLLEGEVGEIVNYQQIEELNFSKEIKEFNLPSGEYKITIEKV
jgi:hypothetical protein